MTEQTADERRAEADRKLYEMGVAVTRLLQEVTRAKLAKVDPEAARVYLR